MICTTLIECYNLNCQDRNKQQQKEIVLKNRNHKIRTQNLQSKRNRSVKLFNFREHIRKI